MSAINMDVDALYEELAKIRALVAASAKLVENIVDDGTDHASVLLSLADDRLLDLQNCFNLGQAEGETT